jgi:5'-3' exonuclease
MILIDNNQIIIGSLFAQTRNGEDFSEDLVRHMVLNTYRFFKNKFSKEYGELVICHDSGNVWRKDFFPEYKANRKKQKEKSSLNWDDVFTVFDIIRTEVKENFPYKHLFMPKCEADDIIATMCKKYHSEEKIMIISSDKDFQQLQRYENVKQYTPLHKKLLVCEDPQSFLIEHIIKGDSSDGIPNLLSDDDAFINKDKRQRPCGKVKIAKILEDLTPWTKERNWQRNQTLIDFSYIPEDLESQILEQFDSQETAGRSNMLNYMITHRLRNLIDVIEDF